jgi:DNA adenine methylase
MFELEPERSVLVDTCKPLISFYEAIKREPDSVHDELEHLKGLEFGEETFSRIKQEWSGHDFGVKFAARLIYLNKLCYNGLFRLNKKLKFNVAWGKKKKLPSFPSLNEFRYAASVLGRTKLYHRDYSRILRATHAGDVVYADPPYWGTYDRYAGGAFKEREHRKLALMLRRASERGVTVFTSNVDCEEVRRLYEHWADIEVVPVNHIIGCTSGSRRKVNEVLVAATGPFVDKRQLNLFGLPQVAETDGISGRA